MAYRNGIVLQLGAIATSVNIDGAVIKDESFKTICRGTNPGGTPHAPAAVKNNVACPECKNADYPSFEKARNVGTTRKPEYAIIDAEKVTETRLTAVGMTKDVIQLSVHKTSEVSTQTIQGDSVYWLAPHKPALAPLYSMMLDALQRHPELTFLGQWTPVARVGLYQFKPFGDTLVMEARHRTEAIKVEQQPVIPIGATEQGMVDAILSTLVKPFDPVSYEDAYKRNLDALVASAQVEAGIATDVGRAAAAASVPAGTVDLAAVLAAALAGVPA